MHAYNPGTWEAEARGSLVGGQPELHSKNLSLKKKSRKFGCFKGLRSGCTTIIQIVIFYTDDFCLAVVMLEMKQVLNKEPDD